MSLPKTFPFTLLLIAVLLTNVYPQRRPNHQQLRNLTDDLRNHPWEGPFAATIPLSWDLRLTEPMRRILDIGAPAQDILIESINNSLIRDQVIILLGGVGDERSIGPIIKNMIGVKDLKSTPHSERINLVANIALTNITVADVIWHYGGGVVRIDPPTDSKERWMRWWKKNKGTFTVKGLTRSRNYSNYPNYGIYKQP